MLYSTSEAPDPSLNANTASTVCAIKAARQSHLRQVSQPPWTSLLVDQRETSKRLNTRLQTQKAEQSIYDTETKLISTDFSATKCLNGHLH
eukprot:scaffold250328_cov24-Prasinocladus_malaysianus.AAC.1